MELHQLPLNNLTMRETAIQFDAINQTGLAAIGRLAGQLIPILINRQSGRILNPLALLPFADQADSFLVNVVFVDLPPEHDLLYAIILNGGIDGRLCGQPNIEQMMNLIFAAVERFDEDLITALGIDWDYTQEILDTYAYGRPRKATPTPDMPDTSGMDWSIPTLNLERQFRVADTIDNINIIAWGKQRGTVENRLTHFYQDDYKFSAVIKNPKALIETRPMAFIEPNFSTAADMPAALVIADIWRKRHFTRTCQDAGIPAIVDLNVARPFMPLNLLGVPVGWSAYATRAYADDLALVEEAYQVACDHCGSTTIDFWVLGGKAARALCEQRGWFWIDQAVRGMDG